MICLCGPLVGAFSFPVGEGSVCGIHSGWFFVFFTASPGGVFWGHTLMIPGSEISLSVDVGCIHQLDVPNSEQASGPP